MKGKKYIGIQEKLGEKGESHYNICEILSDETL